MPENNFKRTAVIVTLVIMLAGALTSTVAFGIKLGKEIERNDNLERAVVGIKATQVEMLERQRNTELNTYAIAVKLNIEGIIKPYIK